MPGMVETVVAKLQTLNQEQLAELDAFIAKMQPSLNGDEDGAHASAATNLSEAAFAAVWSNPEDDAYDEL